MASKLVISTIFIFDLIALGLAIAAELHRSKAKVVLDREKRYTYCVYERDVASTYGLGAFMFLSLSQIVVMAVTKCYCCGRALRPGFSRGCALIMCLLCWVTFIIAEACLLAGTVRNARHTRYRTVYFEKALSCQALRKGVFAAGAAFTLFTAILSELYYVYFAKANYSPQYGQANIGMIPYS